MSKILRPQAGPQEEFLATPANIAVYGGAAGGGKAQPLNELVLTPYGFKPMGSLKVGSKVIGKSGHSTEVIQIHPQGVKKVYEVTFIDGAKTRCTDEHLWLAKVARSKTKLEHRDSARIYDTATLKALVDSGKNMLVPLCEVVHFTGGVRQFKIAPYTFGALMGDGCMVADVISITKNDTQLFEEIKKDGYTLREYKTNDGEALQRAFGDFSEEKRWLKENELLCRGEHKYIPDAYKYSSVENRLSLLQGLMDTDGYADGRGHCEFSSTSKRLAEDVQWLVRSLGGKATITSKIPVCVFPDGAKKECREAYRVYIQTCDNSQLFRLKRKKERCEGKKFNGGASKLSRRITSIEECGYEECQCITISEPDGLYITNDFVVTHNSFGLLMTPLRYKNVPNFGMTIFRKNFNQIFAQGGLWDEATKMYGGLQGALVHKGESSWTFDCGNNQVSKVSFAHIERDEDLSSWQGSQLCCRIDTPVLMADGTYKNVLELKRNDFVMTLNGASRIVDVGEVETKECVLARFPNGDKQEHTTNHAILTKQGWVSYDDIGDGTSTVVLEDVLLYKGTPHGSENAKTIKYKHPYTDLSLESEPHNSEETCLEITPIGKRIVRNITVAEYSHYITKSGLINKNCGIGFDELTHFSRQIFFYMLSRNRSACGVKPFVRATCNPDANSWVAEFISWWIDQETGYAIPERSGKLRWFIRRDDQIYWADKKSDLWEQFNLRTPEEKEEPKSVTFIMSSIYDNKELLKVNPQYLANLKALGVVDRERLLLGNWKIKPSAGLFFKRSQVNMIETLPNDIQFCCRAWDLAATEEIANRDSDYTAGVLLGIRKDKTIVVMDVINQRLKASDVEKLVYNTALIDRKKYGARYKIRIPQDPGAAGKIVAQTYVKMLTGFSVKAMAVTGSKQLRATPFAAQWQNGNVSVLIAEWNDSYLSQLEFFPEYNHDDMVDASSDAFTELTSSTFNVSNLI